MGKHLDGAGLQKPSAISATAAVSNEAGGNRAAEHAHIRLGYNDLWQVYEASLHRPVSSANQPPEQELKHFGDLFETFTRTQQLEQYDYVHSIRFRHTAAYFGKELSETQRIVELGGHSRLGVFAREVFGSEYQGYEQDLRERFDLDTEVFDSVLCLEVIEHIKDAAAAEVDMESIASFNYSGVMNVFAESFRVLRPGGSLLMTTPNAFSVDVVGRVLLKQHPHLFEPHVREMTPFQIKAFGEAVGFTLERWGTFFAWTTMPQSFREAIFAFGAANNLDMSDRGDDAFFVFRKPPA